MRKELIKILKHDEGVMLKPYTDTVGKLTIGVGRNLTDNGLTEDEIDYLLNNDIDRCIHELSVKFDWFLTEKENVQIVLISMVFNLGMPRFLGFKKMIAAIENEDYKEAAAQMLDSKWARQVGKRANRLSELIQK